MISVANIKKIRTLYNENVFADVYNSTSKTALWSFNIPTNLLKVGDRILINVLGRYEMVSGNFTIEPTEFSSFIETISDTGSQIPINISIEYQIYEKVASSNFIYSHKILIGTGSGVDIRHKGHVEVGFDLTGANFTVGTKAQFSTADYSNAYYVTNAKVILIKQ